MSFLTQTTDTKELLQPQKKVDFLGQLPREKAEKMKSFTQSAIAKFVAKFLSDNGSEELVDAWNTQENIEAFNIVAVKRGSSDKIKDPNKPKRGKSAYIFFCSKKREEAKANLGDGAKATEVTSELGRMWNALKASDKKADKKLLASLEAEAADDKARYNEAMEDYVAPSDEELAAIVPAKKARKTSDKDPNAPKRGRSAYIFFCSAMRPQVKEDLGEEGKSSIMSELGKRWKQARQQLRAAFVHWRHLIHSVPHTHHRAGPMPGTLLIDAPASAAALSSGAISASECASAQGGRRSIRRAGRVHQDGGRRQGSLRE